MIPNTESEYEINLNELKKIKVFQSNVFLGLSIKASCKKIIKIILNPSMKRIYPGLNFLITLELITSLSKFNKTIVNDVYNKL